MGEAGPEETVFTNQEKKQFSRRLNTIIMSEMFNQQRNMPPRHCVLKHLRHCTALHKFQDVSFLKTGIYPLQPQAIQNGPQCKSYERHTYFCDHRRSTT